MRNTTLYPKLAVQSIRNNRKFYLPYILALLGDVAAMYIMSALFNDPNVSQMTPGRPTAYYYVQVMMSLGMVIAYMFSVIFVLYINGFLIKQRKKELGLYNILGMGKQHIAIVLTIETVFIGILGIGGGFAVGLILHKLVSLILHQLLRVPAPFGFYVCWKGMRETGILFGVLLLATLLVNLNKVRVSKPIELLHGGNVGEREPKTRWLMTFLGIITLGAGYYIAISTRSGVEALMWYFVAVGLVIIGTYCLFTAVTIFVLKALRKNKKFYYQTGHFIGISGMLYRMKQNAVGLANICILCTMVMVMLSGTLSLYLGTEDMIKEQYPGNINVRVYYDPDADDAFQPDAMLAVQLDYIKSQGIAVTSAQTSQTLSFTAGLLPDGTYTTDRSAEGIAATYTDLTFITESEYTAVTGKKLDLLPGETAAYGLRGDDLVIHWVDYENGTDLGTATYPIRQKLQNNPHPTPNMIDLVTIVMPDIESIHGIWEMQSKAYSLNKSSMAWYAYLDLDCDEDTIYELEDNYYKTIEIENDGFFAGTGQFTRCSWDLRSRSEEESYGLAGGFLFLGLFLGFIFLMATVLIIYYKQISEGYEDKDRFEIMQKVGLSRAEVKRSIHSQILMVFFMPITVATIHIVFDFNMVEKLLTLFMIQNSKLTALCTLGTVLVFFAAYGVVYVLTARTYYKIVER